MNLNSIDTYKKALQFAVWGGFGGASGSLLAELLHSFLLQPSSGESQIQLVAKTGIWFSIIGTCIGGALLIAAERYLQKAIQIKQILQNGLWVGCLAGFIAGAIAQFIYADSNPNQPPEYFRVFCWGIAGALLGLGLSFPLPNLGKIRGLTGGFIGGLLGGSLFVLIVKVMNISGILGRFIGVAAIGFCIGLAIVIIETTFREAWLEIYYSPKEIRTVSLGSEPITIGSNSKTCTIYARHVPSETLRYYLSEGQIFCEDIPTGKTSRLKSGDAQTLGNLSLVVRTAGTSLQNQQDLDTSQFQTKFSLQIKGREIPLELDTQLRATELPGLESKRADGVVAEVVTNPNEPSICGLRNLSHRTWTVKLANGEQRQIDFGRSIKLAFGTQIDFGSTKGEIKNSSTTLV